MRRWLSLFAFTLLVIGGVLAYEGYRVFTDPERTLPFWQTALLVIGALVSVALGLVGLVERHRRRRQRWDSREEESI